MARLTRPRKDGGSNRVEVTDITDTALEGARPLVLLLALNSGQIAAWPFEPNIYGLDTEDVDRLTEAVRATLLHFVRKMG